MLVGNSDIKMFNIIDSGSPLQTTQNNDSSSHEVPSMLKTCTSTHHCHCVQGVPMCHDGHCHCLFAIQLGHDGTSDNQQSTVTPQETITKEPYNQTIVKEPDNGSEAGII